MCVYKLVVYRVRVCVLCLQLHSDVQDLLCLRVYEYELVRLCSFGSPFSQFTIYFVVQLGLCSTLYRAVSCDIIFRAHLFCGGHVGMDGYIAACILHSDSESALPIEYYTLGLGHCQKW